MKGIKYYKDGQKGRGIREGRVAGEACDALSLTAAEWRHQGVSAGCRAMRVVPWSRWSWSRSRALSAFLRRRGRSHPDPDTARPATLHHAARGASLVCTLLFYIRSPRVQDLRAD